METIENGKINKTYLGLEDRGIMTFFIFIDFNYAGQVFGGYMLDTYDKEDDKRVSSERLGFLVTRLIETFEVSSWEEINGLYCRAKRPSKTGPITSIGHITKDNWFDIEELKRIKI